MNEPGNNPPTYARDNNEQVEDLRFQMNLLFGCLLVATLTLAIYLGLQARRASLDVLTFKGPATDSMRQVQQENAHMEATYTQLKDFARTHPDFDKVVLSNFHLNTNTAPAEPAKK